MAYDTPSVELDNQIRVEWIILADHAEVVNQKLYLVGGGWDVIVRQQGTSEQHPLSVAVAFRVPWTETNSRHHIELELQDADATALAKVDGYFEVGRPAGMPAGTPQRFQLAVNHIPFSLEKPGTYAFVARVDGEDDPNGRATFRVVGSG